MVQEILMWISVGGAFVYAIFSIIKLVYNTSKKTNSLCSSSGCCGCEAKRSLIKQIKHKDFSSFKPLTNH